LCQSCIKFLNAFSVSTCGKRILYCLWCAELKTTDIIWREESKSDLDILPNG
jgi:hypothetical protein